MRRNCRRFLCFMLAALLLIPLLPASVSGSAAVADDLTYGKTIKENVNFRVGPSMRDGVMFQIPIRTVCTVHGQETANGFTWYKADARNPQTNAVLTGYIRSDCFVLLTAEETAAYTGTMPTVTTAPSTDTAAAAGTTGYITNDGVNFRVEPNGQVIESVNRGTVMTVLTIPSVISEDTWYKVEYNGRTGYIMSPFLNLTGTTPVVTAVPVPTATPNPDALGYVMTIKGSVNIRASIGGTSLTTVGKWVTMPYLLPPVKNGNYTWYFVQVSATLKGYVRSDCVKLAQGPGSSTVTAAPAITQAPTVQSGYVATTIDYVNVRTGVWGNLISVVQKAGSTFPYYNYIDSNGIRWYYIYSPDFGYAYIHGKFVKVTDDATPATATPAPSTVTATPEPVSTDPTGYVATTADDVNVRKAAWGQQLGSIKKKGTVVPYYGAPTMVSGNNWYYVNVPGIGYGYILGKFLQLTDDSGAVMTPTPTPAPGAVTPTPVPGPVTAAPVTAGPTATAAPASDDPTGYVSTTTDTVNVRKDAWGKLLGSVKNKGTVLPYYGEPKVVSGNNWYYVNVPGIGYGYILGKFLKLTDESGAAVTPTPTPAPEAIVTPSGLPVNTPAGSTTPGTAVSEADYTTLKAGSSGPAVQNLVRELINQGYFKGSVTSNYTSAVENAVRAFQSAKGLAVDGIAGTQTQHALFNTVPIGTANRADMTMTLYPAEKIDWYTGGIQELWPRGTNVKVYDVYTGLVWWAHRWAGGLHVDAEPLTAADTATLCKIYGVSKASDIKESTHWQRRPCLITIGTRTFACSLYGVPHNPDGNTIKDNNYDGQLCIHFTNSKIHKSGKVDSNHEAAIQYAWEHAPNGHK